MRNKIFSTIIFFCLLSLISFESLQAAYYTVSGYVYLENQTDHSGVKVKFYNLPSMELEDSTTSQANGSYSINVSPGYYLVEWTKIGYVPWELGGFALAENTVLDPVYLLAGQVQEVSGNVSGTWTSGFVYYVMDNITVPLGSTLTINSGVRVKFTKGTSLTCNGKLIVNGTSAKPVLFTSKEPTPLPGDWGNVTLNSTYNSLNYLQYEYASDGIVGSSASYTTIDHLTIQGNLALTARGIYFTDSQNLTFTNNFISIAGEYGIYADNSDNSTFSGNTIITPTYGLRADYSDNSVITDNTITTGDNTTGPKHAIYTPNSPRIRIENNTIVADENGIYTLNSSEATIKNNNITGRIDRNGIQLNNSDSTLIYQNYVHRTRQSSNIDNWHFLIDADEADGAEISENDLYSWNTIQSRYNAGIRCQNSVVKQNEIEVRFDGYYQMAIWDNSNSEIIENTIRYTLNNDWCGSSNVIVSYSNGDKIRNVVNNTINYTFDGGSHEIIAIMWCQSNKIIRNNIINVNNMHRAIYCQSNCDVDSNDISGDFDNHVIEIDGDNTTIHDNKITQTGGGNGIWVRGQTGIEIKNNTFKQSSCAKFLLADNSQINVHHNVVTTGSGRGAYIYNQSGGSVWNNTIVSKSSGDYGIYIENQTNIPVYNNIVTGFQNGLYADNTIKNYNLDHNAFWNLSGVMFNGNAIPPLAGQIIDDNANGDPSDIYENINLDPQFVYPDTNNYNLLGSSPCINAGYNAVKDPDSTVADIGALYYPIYIVINHTQLTSTDNTTGPYTVNAEIISPSGLTVTAQVYYSTDNQNFTAINMTKGSGNNFFANIPGQPLNTTIYYYIKANDGTHDVTAPRNLNAQVYSFYITLFSQFANLSGQSEVDGKINLGWATPIPISGTLTGLKLYRSLSINCEMTEQNLYQTFTADVTSYTDANVEEGYTYYYRLTGLLDSGGTTTESVVCSILGIMSNDATIVRVRGVALLKSATYHAETKVFFEKASPSAVSDSVLTDAAGKYDKLLVTGIYNAHFSHTGYQPILLGNLFFADNANIDTVTLVPGGTINLTGNVEGTLTSNNLYLVDGDITIPQGKTLAIEAGTQILFKGNYSLTANGKLFINGSPENKVIFGSRRPVPAVGDWGCITLNDGADNSVLKYAKYQYATDGFICNNLDSVTILGMTINTLAINARGITLNNCENVDIRYNTINVAGDWTIYKPNSDWDNSGKFIGNTITTPQSGMYVRYFYNLTIDSNSIENKNYGIQTDYSRNLKCRYNTVTGQDHHIGIHSYNCDDTEIAHNKFRGANDYGYYLDGCDNGIISDNEFYYSGNVGWVRGFNSAGSNNLFTGNRILIDNIIGETSCWIGFENGSNNIYTNNRIEVWHNFSDASNAFRNINNSTFKNNYLKVQSRQSSSDWPAFYGNNNISENDTLILGENTRGYYGSGWKIKNCIIKSPSSNSGYEAIYCTGGTLEVSNVLIEGCYRGIYGSGAGGYVKNSLIKVYGSDYGLKFESNSNMNLYQNTIIGKGYGNGIVTASNATLKTNSNLIYGFTTGISAESPNYTQTSLLYNNTNYFTGSALSPQVGQVVTVNGNATPSDIYGNIFLDPQFVSPSAGDYSLKSNSPAINAGDNDSLDVDGTIADIGALFFNFGYVPQNLAVRSTGDGWVEIGWSISSTDSLTGFKGYYKLSTGSTWTSAGQTAENYLRFNGLTNNVSYDFVVAAVYPSKESLKSQKITEKPGVAIIEISPKYITVFQQPGETTVKEFTITNDGNKDLVFSIKVDRATLLQNFDYLGEFNGHYYYQSKNNAYWSAAKLACENAGGHLVTITSQSENNFIYNNKKSSEVWIGFSDQETEGVWKWVTNESVVYTNWYSGQPDNSGNEDYGELWNNDSGTWNDGNEHQQPFILEIDNYIGITSVSNGTVSPQVSIVIKDTLKTALDGVFISKVIINSNAQINAIDSICALQIVGNFTSLNPIQFTPLNTTDNAFNFVLESATIDGSPLQTGDEVGIFDGEVCVGAGGFNGSFPMIITCYGADGGAPGFTAGDSIIIKLYDASQARFAMVSAVNYTFGDGHFIDGGFAKATLQGSVYQTVNIPLAANRFNLISSYLYPRYPNTTTLFSSVPGLKIAYEDNGSAFIPQYNINTIGDLDITEGYHLFVAGTDRALTVSGLAINPQDFPLTLANNRFNSIGYLLDEPAAVTTIFYGIVDHVSIVQDDDGGVWIPELNINTLGNLQPLSGYQIFVTGTGPIEFTYPDLNPPPATKPAIAVAPEVQPKQYQFNKTGLPYTIVVTSVMMDGQELSDGDEISVFWNELCVGAAVYQRGKAQVLSAWKGDDELEIPGYKAGDGIQFRAYSGRFKQEFELDAHFAQTEQSRFEGAAYAVVNLTGQPGLIPERYCLHQNYPNPFNSRTIIPYDIPQEANVSLVIYDLLGKEVVRLKDHQFHQPGKYRYEWSGLDKNGIGLSSGIYFVRLISQDYQKVQKLVLMK